MIITIARESGSGGYTVGKLLSDDATSLTHCVTGGTPLCTLT